MTDQEPPWGVDGGPAAPPPLPLIPDHELIRCIGSGAYGQIWLVKSVLGAHRAAKVVFRKSFDSERPYMREFCGIQSYEPHSRSHEGLVDILQVGKNDEGGYFYYLMELADDQLTRQSVDPETYLAKTVGREIQLRGRIPAAECIGIGLAVTSALDHLHNRGLVHRDIKPENIIYIDGKVKLADIGLVAEIGSTKTNVGTEGFVPPEGSGTPQADLYAVGKLLYEMATGRDRFYFPEPSTSVRELSDAHESPRLNKIIHKACSEDRQHRYYSARLMYADLMRAELELKSIGRPWWRKPFAIGTVLAIGFAALFVILVVMVRESSVTDTDDWHIRGWAESTEALEGALLAEGIRLPEGSDGDGPFVVSLVLGRGGVDAIEVPTETAPTGMLVPMGQRSVWQVRQSAGNYSLQSGPITWLAVRVHCSSNQDGAHYVIMGDGVECTVFTLEPPETLNVDVVFQVPKDLKGEGCLMQYQRGLFLLETPLTKEAETGP